MITILGTILAFVIVFGILVFIHEFGHFFMAKLVGIRVESFSFGYGKRLFGFKKGHTDYRISVLPLGGYVKFLGEGMFEPGRDARPGRFHGQDRAGSGFSSSSWAPVMNILLAVVIVAGDQHGRRDRARVPGPGARSSAGSTPARPRRRPASGSTTRS